MSLSVPYEQAVTIIIPTRNRHVYLNRILYYIKDQPFNFIIADNSANPFILPEGQGFPVNVRYLKTENPGFAQKVLSALEYVKTPYAMMCADDDFMLTSAIHLGITFLNQNPDYAAVHGYTLS